MGLLSIKRIHLLTDSEGNMRFVRLKKINVASGCSAEGNSLVKRFSNIHVFTGEPSRYMICFPFKSFSLEKKIYLPAMRISLLGDSINVKHYLTLPKIVTINASLSNISSSGPICRLSVSILFSWGKTLNITIRPSCLKL